MAAGLLSPGLADRPEAVEGWGFRPLAFANRMSFFRPPKAGSPARALFA